MSRKHRMFKVFVWVLYVSATLQFVRYYVVGTTFYLDMPRYLSGHERLPFQYRVLPIFLMWPINHSPFLLRHLAHASRGFDARSAATADTLAFYLTSLVSFSVASYLVVRLYRAVTSSGVLSALVFPGFMVLTMWTYVVHIDANFSYPYDMPGLAFFAGGLLAIYQRRYIPLVAIVLIGTLNRETTFFLIGIYAIDSVSRDLSERQVREMGGKVSLTERFAFDQLKWQRVLLLLAIWAGVKVALRHEFRWNDRSKTMFDLGRTWGGCDLACGLFC